MTKEEIKKFMPLMQAMLEGNTIQYYAYGREWVDTEHICLEFDDNIRNYRIKPELKYRPFKNAEECWQEMQKHKPFGWVRENSSGHYKHINNLYTNNISFQETEIAESGNFEWNLSDLLKSYTFADGTPFGIKYEQ